MNYRTPYVILLVLASIGCNNTEKRHPESAINTIPTNSTETQRLEHLLLDTELNSFYALLENGYYFYLPDTLHGKKVYRAYTSHLESRMAVPADANHNFDHDILDYKTFKPIAKHTDYGSLLYDYRKKDTVVLSFITRKDTTYTNVPLKTENFNISGPASVLIGSRLPLEVGFKTQFSRIKTAFPYNLTNKKVTVTEYVLDVVGTEVLKIDDKSHDCYVVEIYPTDGEPGLFFKLWLTKEKPHLELQLVYTHTRNRNSDSLIIHRKRKLVRLK